MKLNINQSIKDCAVFWRTGFGCGLFFVLYFLVATACLTFPMYVLLDKKSDAKGVELILIAMLTALSITASPLAIVVLIIMCKMGVNSIIEGYRKAIDEVRAQREQTDPDIEEMNN